MIIIILFPSILLLLCRLLWPCKRISNEVLEILAYLCMFLPMLIFFFGLKSSTGKPEYGGAVLLSVVMYLANAWQFGSYRKKLRDKRCPICRKLSLKLTAQSKEEYLKTRTKIYRYEGRTGRFMQRSSVLTTFTTYNFWCPNCKEAFVATDKSVDHHQSGEQRIK